MSVIYSTTPCDSALDSILSGEVGLYDWLLDYQKTREFKLSCVKRFRLPRSLLVPAKRIAKSPFKSPGSVLSSAQLRSLRLSQLPCTFTEDQALRALAYFGDRCAACGRPAGLFHILAFDHWIPLVSNREDNPGTVAENMIPLCHSREGDTEGCNNVKHSQDPYYWALRQFGDKKGRKVINRVEAYFNWVRTLS